MAVAAAFLTAAATPAFGASITLDNLIDQSPVVNGDGVCTLREAINETNSDSPGTSEDCHFVGTLNEDTINLPAGKLTLAASGDDANTRGDFDVQLTHGHGLTINGAGTNATVLDGGSLDRLFQLSNSTSSNIGERHFNLHDLTLTHGSADTGGAISTNGYGSSGGSHISLDHVVAEDNKASVGGGAIGVADAIVDLTDSVIRKNQDITEFFAPGGGISVVNASNGENVGVNSVRSVIANNSWVLTGNPFAVYTGGGGVMIYSNDPGAPSFGNFVDSTISNNTMTPPVGTFNLRGAGIFAKDASLTITGSTISGNRINSNPDSRGGFGAGVSFVDSGPDLNPPRPANDDLVIENSTIANNEAVGYKAGSGDPSVGGGLSARNGDQVLTNVTFAGNKAEKNNDLSISRFLDTGGTSKRRGLILASGPAACGQGLGIQNTATGNTGNIELGDDSCGFTGGGDHQNVSASDLKLGVLGDNGGLTQTIPIGAGSVAADTLAPADCLGADGNPLGADQRGIARPAGSGCDSGAYELSTCQGQPVTVIGTDGDDSLQGTHGDDSIAAGDGNDTIDGMDGADAICAGDGDDVVDPGGDGDADTVDGGGGTDTLSYANATGPVTVDIAAGTATGQGSDAVPGFENIIGGDSADTLTGSAGPNVITGGDGADQISALGSGDTIFARDGLADNVDCGAGTDSAEADVSGTDALTACETTDLMPSPPGAGPSFGGPGPEGGSPSPGTTPGSPAKKCKKAKKKKGKKRAAAAKKPASKNKKGCKKK